MTAQSLSGSLIMTLCPIASYTTVPILSERATSEQQAIILAVSSGDSVSFARPVVERRAAPTHLACALRSQHVVLLVDSKDPHKGFFLGSMADIAHRSSTVGVSILNTTESSSRAAEVNASGVRITAGQMKAMGLEGLAMAAVLATGFVSTPAATSRPMAFCWPAVGKTAAYAVLSLRSMA